MNPAASPVAPSFFEWCSDLPALFIGANIQWRKMISIDICNAELFIYLRWASQHWLQLSVRAKFISVNCLEPWVVETSFTVGWWKPARVDFSAVSQVCDLSKNWDGTNLLGLLGVLPSLHLTVIHETQVSSVFPLQPMNWATQLPSQDHSI